MTTHFVEQSVAPEALLTRQDDPVGLEALFRERPAAFAEALSVALDQAPESVVLRVWAARLDLELADPGPPPAAGWQWAEALDPARALRLLWAAAALVVVAGTWAKLPEILGWAGEAVRPDGASRADLFLMRSVPFLAVGPVLVLAALRYRTPPRVLGGVAAGALLLAVVQGVRPMEGDAGVLSVIHAPLVLAALAGVAALGARWRETEARIGLLRLVGETVAFAGLLGLGGVVLLAVTVALFEALGVDVEPIFEWVGVYGAIGVLPVAALLVSQRVEAARVAPLVARVFGPMALVVLAVYLPTLVATGGLEDRDSLLTLNVALVAVLALVVLMQAERPDVRRHWTDPVAVALVAVALLADLAALASIAERLAGGMTPNRLAVVGLNALAAVHLAGLVLPLGRRALGRAPGLEAGDGWTARFLTVYAGWAAVVVLVLPLLF